MNFNYHIVILIVNALSLPIYHDLLHIILLSLLMQIVRNHIKFYDAYHLVG